MLSKPKLLVFPTSRAIRHYLTENSDTNMLLPTLLTIDEFLKKSVLTTNYKYCDEEQRTLLLNKACENIDLEKLGISKEFNKFLKQSDYIYRFLNELASEKIDINEIRANDIYEYYEEHLSILNQISKNYKAILEENKYVDRVNFSKTYSINEDFIKNYESININFEGYFTKQEFEIIEKISQLISININFYKNEYNSKSIDTFFDSNKLDDDFYYSLNLSKKEIFYKESLLSKENLSLDIKAYSQRVNQIAFIKSSVVDAINKGFNASNIAVILPDEKFATQLQLFDNEKYFNYAMGKSIENTKLYESAYAIYTYILEDEIKYIENINFLELEKIFIDDYIKPLFRKLASKENFEFVVEYLRKFIDCDELRQKFDELVYKFEYLMFSFENQLKIKDVYKIFLQKLSKIKLDDINSGKITVMGLLETRNISFDVVIIPDFNEEFIPKKSVKDKFLSTNIKKSVNLPTIEDRENLQKYYYKRLITSSKQVYISYVQNDVSTISRFASKLFDMNNIDFEKVFDKSYFHILYKNHNFSYKNEEIKMKLDLSKIVWSASSLKTFLECKRKYYLKSILRLNEHELSLKPKSFELGSIIHSILEKYHKSKDESKQNLMNIFNEYKSTNAFLTFDLYMWKQKLEKFYDYDKLIFKDNSTIESEKIFEIPFNGMKIKGVIDRIDKKIDDSYEIIDYKTSSNLKVDTLRTYEKSKDFQLEFYYLAVNQLYKTQNIKSYYYDLHNTKVLQEVVLEEKLDILSNIFEEFKSLSKEEISFDKCEEKSTCQYCIYKTICNRE